MRIIAGLGNPGAQYDGTRHNLGFVCIDELAKLLGAGTWRSAHGGFLAEVQIGGKKALLFKPRYFMNRSGDPLQALLTFYKESASNLVVVLDDIYLEPGTARIRQGGGDGGHNGMKSLMRTMTGQNFWRVRIGVGVYAQDPESRVHLPPLEDYVLQKAPKEDMERVSKLIDTLIPNLVGWLEHGAISEETIHI
jgi:PTH1 family peptidyl-tRNA hydrolase